MNLKNLLLIASLFVASSLHADPLTWRFNGTTLPGSTYNGTSIEGLKFQLQIFLNTTLISYKTEGLSEFNFDGPFRGQVVISGVGTLPVALFSHVQNFPVQGGVSDVIFFFYDHRISAGFSPPIPSNPRHLGPIPETPIKSTEPGCDAACQPDCCPEFFGPNELHVIGDLDSFSATTGPLTVELPGDGRTPSGPGVVAGKLSDFDFIEVFVRGNDDHVYLNVMYVGIQQQSDFTSWVPVPGDQSTISEPAAVIYNGVLKLFVRDQDSKIYEADFTGSPIEPDTGWSPWSEVPGEGLTLSGPAAVVGQDGVLRLFVRGFDDEIYENDLRGGSFKEWRKVPAGGLTISTPAAVVHNKLLKLFVRGIDNRIYENDFAGSSFTVRQEVHGGGLTLAGPSALVHQGILKLFVTGLDDRVWENDFNGSSFDEWSPVSGDALTPSAPAAVEAFRHVMPPAGYPTVFLRGEDGRIFQGFF